MVGQFISSVASPQSLSLSHLQVASIQRPPSHFHLASIHLEPSAHLNWASEQAPVQFLSSQLSLQSLSALMPNSNALMVPNVLTPDGNVMETMTVPMHLMSFPVPVTAGLV